MSDQKWNDESFEKIQQHYTRKSSNFSLDDIINEVKGKPASSPKSSYFEKLRSESDDKKQQIQSVVDDYKNKARQEVTEQAKHDPVVPVGEIIDEKQMTVDLPQKDIETQVIDMPPLGEVPAEIEKLEKVDATQTSIALMMENTEEVSKLSVDEATNLVVQIGEETQPEILKKVDQQVQNDVLQAPRYPSKEDLKKNLTLLKTTDDTPEILFDNHQSEEYTVIQGSRVAPVFLGADFDATEKIQNVDKVNDAVFLPIDDKTAQPAKKKNFKKRKQNDLQVKVNTSQVVETANLEEQQAEEGNNVISEDVFSAIQQKRSSTIVEQSAESTDEVQEMENTFVAGEKNESKESFREPLAMNEELESAIAEEDYDGAEGDDITSAEWIAWLRKKSRGASVRCVVTFFAILFSSFLMLGRYMPSFLPESLDFYSHSVHYVSASAIALLVAGIVNANVLWSGICRAIRFRFSAEGVAFVCFLVSGLYDLYFLFHWEAFAAVGYITFDLLAILCIWGCALGRKITYKALWKNHLLASGNDIKTVISSPYADAADNDVMVEIGRGGDIMYAAYNQKVDPFAEQELYRFDNNKKQEHFFATMFCLLLGVTAVVFAIKGNIVDAFVMLAGGTAAISPMFVSFLSASSTASICKSMRHLDTVVSGVYGAEQLADSAVLVAKDVDVFDAQDVALHGIQIYSNGKIDEIILKMAAIYKEIGGVLQKVFLEMVEHTPDMIPKVADVQFYDPYGYTAKIGTDILAVGSYEFMNQMGVSLDVCGDSYKNDAEGKHTLFFAVQNELQAVFVMSYNASDTANDTIEMIDAEGVSLGLITKDFFVNDRMIKHQFDLQNEDAVSVLSFNTAKACENRIATAKKSFPCIASADGLRGIASALIACSKLLFCNRVNFIIKVVSSVLALPMIAALLLISGVDIMLPLQILVFQAVWTIPALLISVFNRV